MTTRVVPVKISSLTQEVEKHSYEKLLEKIERADDEDDDKTRYHYFAMLLSMLEEDKRRSPAVYRIYSKMDYFFNIIWGKNNMIDSLVAFVYKAMGLMHLNFENPEKALSYFKTSFFLCRRYIEHYKTMDEIDETFKTVIYQFPYTLFLLRKNDLVLEEVQTMQDIFDKNPEIPKDANYGAILFVKGEYYAREENFERVLKYSRKGLKLLREDNDLFNDYESMALKNIARAHIVMKNYDMAIQTCDKLLARLKSNFGNVRFFSRDEKEWLKVQHMKGTTIMLKLDEDPDLGLQAKLEVFKDALSCFKAFYFFARKRNIYPEVVKDGSLKALYMEVEELTKTTEAKVKEVQQTQLEMKKNRRQTPMASSELVNEIIDKYNANENSAKETIAEVNKVLEMKFQKGDNFLKLKTHYLKCYCYKSMNKMGHVIESCQTAIDQESLSKKESKVFLVKILRILGETYLTLEFYDEAMNLFEKNLQNSAEPQKKIEAMINYGFCLIQKGKIPEANRLLMEAKDNLDKIVPTSDFKEMSMPIRVRNYLGLIHYRQQSYYKALEYFESVPQEVNLDEMQDPFALTKYYFHHASCLRHLKKLDSVVELTDKGIMWTEVPGKKLPIIRHQLTLIQSLANYERGSRDLFVNDVLELFFEDDTNKLRFDKASDPLSKINVADQSRFFRYITKCIFDYNLRNYDLKSDMLEKLKILRKAKAKLRFFQNTVKINQWISQIKQGQY